MNVENHPLLREHPELSEQLLTRSMADGGFAQLVQRYASLDTQVQNGGNAQTQQEYAALRQQLLDELNKPVTSCCGSCGGGGH